MGNVNWKIGKKPNELYTKQSPTCTAEKEINWFKFNSEIKAEIPYFSILTIISTIKHCLWFACIQIYRYEYHLIFAFVSAVSLIFCHRSFVVHIDGVRAVLQAHTQTQTHSFTYIFHLLFHVEAELMKTAPNFNEYISYFTL